MGHEFCGTIERPSEAPSAHGVRVVVNPLISCGACRCCRTGLANLCPRRSIIGAHRPGAFAELVAVPERNCHPISPGLDPALAAVTEPLACGLRAVEVARIAPGESVLVLGCGMIGLSVLIAAERAGAAIRAVTDTHSERLEAAGQWRATHRFGPDDDPAAALRRLTDGFGVDVAVDAVGLTETRRTAVASVRPGGRVVLIGLHEAESAFAANDIVRSEIHIAGSFAYRPETFAGAVRLLEQRLIACEGGWLETRALDAGPQAFEDLLGSRVTAAKISLAPRISSLIHP
jgi:threonine dehydrogenase-like Zn-dependent dehydrogenase